MATVNLKLAYCAKCSPPVPLAVGPLPEPPRHFGPRGQAVHVATLVDISPDEAAAKGEKPYDFLTRMMKKYVTKK